jgi:hypothetical protein
MAMVRRRGPPDAVRDALNVRSARLSIAVFAPLSSRSDLNQHATIWETLRAAVGKMFKGGVADVHIVHTAPNKRNADDV